MTPLEKTELPPSLDRIVDQKKWKPPYYSQLPIPEDFGIKSSQIPALEQEEKRLREVEQKKSRALFKIAVFGSAGVGFIFGLLSGGPCAAVGAAVVAALFPGLYPLALLLQDTVTSEWDRLKHHHLQPYYDYKVAVSHYGYWQRKQNIDYLRSLTGIEFEHAVGAILNRLGYVANVTKASGDGGIDIIATIRSSTFAIQCKNHQKAIGPATVREMIGALGNPPAGSPVIVSSSGFTHEAWSLARGNFIILLDDAWLRSPSQISEIQPIAVSRDAINPLVLSGSKASAEQTPRSAIDENLEKLETREPEAIHKAAEGEGKEAAKLITKRNPPPLPLPHSSEESKAGTHPAAMAAEKVMAFVMFDQGRHPGVMDAGTLPYSVEEIRDSIEAFFDHIRQRPGASEDDGLRRSNLLKSLGDYYHIEDWQRDDIAIINDYYRNPEKYDSPPRAGVMERFELGKGPHPKPSPIFGIATVPDFRLYSGEDNQ